MRTGQSFAEFLVSDENLQKHIAAVAHRWLILQGVVPRPAALSPEQVQEVLNRVESGESQAAVARAFGVTRVTIHYIVKKGRGQRRLARLAGRTHAHNAPSDGTDHRPNDLEATVP